MPYTPTVWADEIPASTPIKYKVTDDSAGIIANSAKIELVTSVTAGTPINATNLNKMETAIAAAVAAAEAALVAAAAAEIASRIPVGWCVETTTPTNPAVTLGYGTWSEYGTGRVFVAAGTSDQEFSAGATGGESSHALSAAENGTHTHTQNPHNHPQDAHAHAVNTTASWVDVSSGLDASAALKLTNGSTSNATATNQAATATNQNSGSGTAHNNLQPYIVGYRWLRTA